MTNATCACAPLTPVRKIYVRFVSLEPMLGALSIERWLRTEADSFGIPYPGKPNRLDWVIGGGGTGPGAEPMHPDWPRSIRDQCVGAGIPFLFKGWGEWLPQFQIRPVEADLPNRRESFDWGDGNYTHRVGKKAAGRLLDGRTWDEMPQWLSCHPRPIEEKIYAQT